MSVQQPITFEAVIEPGEGGGAFVRIPFDVEQAFGNKRPRVKVVFDGNIEYRGSLVRYGIPEHMLIVLKEIREKLGKQAGDSIHVKVEADTAERKVDLPPPLLLAFAAYPEAETRFRQREYVQYINEAKRPETVQRRVMKTVERLMK
jgi:hypothetical protein